MNDTKLVEIVQDGNHTAEQVAEASGLSVGHVYRVLKDAAERGVLGREKDGHEWQYHVPEGTETVDDFEGDDVMPVARNYDWDALVPEETVEYLPHDGELDELSALIETRETIGQPVRALIGGPTGCGKTTLAEYIAAENGWPLFTIQGKYTMREKDLLGSPLIIGGETRWTDGILTKALLASADRPVVLLVDEANRARAQAKSVLFSALDHRAEVTLDGGRGGELIDGDAMNLIVIATINEGDGYMVEQMDLAEKRRFGAKWNVDYLGIEYPDREAGLVAERSGVSTTFARALVDAANSIRQTATDPTSKIGSGVPTSAVISWAGAARAFEDAGLSNPVVRAGNAQVVRPFYGDDDRVADEVGSIIKSHLDGAPVDAEAFAAWNDDELAVCDDCGFSCSRIEADERGLMLDGCPDCDGELRLAESN